MWCPADFTRLGVIPAIEAFLARSPLVRSTCVLEVRPGWVLDRVPGGGYPDRPRPGTGPVEI